MDLSSAIRAQMPNKDFAGKGKTFPVNDAKHDRLAISGATRSERAGNISAATANKIKAKARKKLSAADKSPRASLNNAAKKISAMRKK